jgi:two-component system, NarL family, sensor histidine kinase DesK
MGTQPEGGSGLVYTGITGRLVDNSAASGRWRLLFSSVWLLYLIQGAYELVNDHHGVWYIIGAFALVAVFCALYIFVMFRWTTRPVWWALPTLFALAALACVWLGGKDWNVLWIYVSAACGLVVPDRKRSLRAVFVASGCFLLFSWIGHDSATDFLWTLLPVVIVGLATSGLRNRTMLLRELAIAREEVERLAANEERLRMARDMHDLTGQSLSMITLKSELAAKLVDRDPDRARDQMEEIAAVSRQTLHDIREAVSGYRRPTLAIETITARTTLTAAGIETRDDPRLITLSGTVDPDAEAALAWCLREAVTNVVRHSSARHCDITLSPNDGELVLTVTDDGRGMNQDGPGGSGLRGISERLAAVGGSLTITGAPGFTLSAAVPARTLTPANVGD